MLRILRTLFEFYVGLFYYVVLRKPFQSCPALAGEADTYVFSLSLMFRMWSDPHYRNPSFQLDLVKNLRNVAVPGTGIPLSVFASSKLTAILFVWIVMPVLAFASSVFICIRNNSLRLQEFSREFRKCLLEPEDWFSLWQLNCRLSSFKHWKSKSKHYALENKWEFLRKAKEEGVSVSPFNSNVETVVLKDKNEEGGMGIYMFKNAVFGGDWIIQSKMKNAPIIANLLPDTAPLSTFRVITMADPRNGEIYPLSCVFRAGLAGASTDHSSLLFNVDLENCIFTDGTSNGHWYHLGIFQALKDLAGGSNSLVSLCDMKVHPDSGAIISGSGLGKKTCKNIVQVSVEAHKRLVHDVPIVGWDVALTDSGCFLLEANLSCNFFRGSFDRKKYFDLVKSYFLILERM